MEVALNNIAENLKNYIVNYFNGFKKDIPKNNSISYLEYRLDKFFKKEKQFLKNKLLLYYEFNKKFLDIPVIPYYISIFYQNLDYIIYCVKYSEWEEIMEIYKNITKINPNYKNSRLTDPKPIYDRRYMLLVLYYIFLIYIYILGHYLYKFISEAFYFLLETFTITEDANLTFLLFIIYIFLIIGIYYHGIPFIIYIIIMFFTALYYILICIYYLLYFIGLILYYLLIGVSRPFVGGNKNNKKKFIGGNIYKDFDYFINSLKNNLDEYTFELIKKIINTILTYILPDASVIINTFNPCDNTTTIEKMLATHNNNSRNTEEPININKKINRAIKNILPTNVQQNEFVKCMYKEEKKEPPKCEN